MSNLDPLTRREFVAGTMAAAAATGLTSSPATADTEGQSKPEDATFNGMPCGFLGKAKVSRLMFGGNLVGGYMHCRDLKYVNQLFRAYVDEEKLMQTLRLAEENGVNTVFETGANYVRKYNDRFQGKMQVIPHIKAAASPREVEDEVKRNIDAGAIAHYCWGVHGDDLVRKGKIDHLKRSVEIAKKYELPVGVGGHLLAVHMACEEHKIPCDFYVKTLHRQDYPSAKMNYDSNWCANPEQVIEFMKGVTKPWVAFKVLAAGAIRPREGLTYAFEGGADFVPLGMFDFQIKEDADLAKRIIRRANTVRHGRCCAGRSCAVEKAGGIGFGCVIVCLPLFWRVVA
jgi:hypothetical protein